MAEDWVPGDRALCVKDDPWLNEWGELSTGPAPGSVSLVEGIEIAEHIECGNTGKPYIGLILTEWPGESYCSCSFTKIAPLTEDEEREARREIEQDKRITAPIAEPANIIWYIDWADGQVIRRLPRSKP